MTRGDVPVVFVEDLVCEYRGFKAVDGVSLAIAQDELFAVLGPNGAGKTTLLETIQGMRAPSAGKVRVFGVDPRDRAASRPRMGIMFQEAGHLGDLTVRETIAAIGMLTGRTDSVDRVLDLIGLRRLAGSRVSQLSGGERRRLDFAVAVYGAPELIFLDEPTTGLDPTAREEVWEQVGLLRRQGATVILTTHYLEEVEQHATRIALMRRGRIVADGTLHDLTSAAPRHIRFRHTGESSGLTNPRSMRAGAWSVITVSDLHSDLSELLSWADSAGVTLDDIQVDSQGLRDYFTNEDGELEHVS